MIQRLLGAMSLVIGFMAAPSLAFADDAEDPFARDVLILAEWFEGDFDNEEQLWFHRRSRAAGDAPTRIHTTHTRIEAPAFGKHVFYVEDYMDDDPSKVTRQRLVTIESDVEENAIRIRQGFFKKGKSLLGAHRDVAKLKGLKPKNVFFVEGCDVFMRRVAGQFEGDMKPKACVFGEGEKRRYSVHKLILSETKFWRTDATFLMSDNSFHAGTPLNEPSQLRKAKTFICDYFFYADKGENQEVKGLQVHSQGGRADAVRKSDGQIFEILVREKEYPFYETRPDFIYYSLRKKGAQRSVAYGVADPESRTFGLNQGEIGAFCHQQGYTFR